MSMQLDEVTVVGSGAGGMAVAAALADRHIDVTVADMEEFATNLDAIADRGGIERRRQDEEDTELVPVSGVTTDLGAATRDASTVVVVAPLLGHEPLLDAMGEAIAGLDGLLFIGEGGGAVRVRARYGDRPRSVAECNTLPYLARAEAPGRVMVRPKQGGVFVAASPVGDTAGWGEALSGFWPWIELADDVFDTVIANYNIIDHVPTVLANAGYLEAGQSSWQLWGEGCTPAVARGIEGLDGELQHLRDGLGLPERRYADCLVAQGFAPRVEETLYETIQGSVLSSLEVERDPEFLQSRFIMEDVPHALVLIESIGRVHDIDLPLTSALITFASVLVGEDLRANGTTLSSLGLPTDATELDERIRMAGA